MEIGGRVALVTGAGSGIGEAIALRLGRDGAAVVVADIDDQAGSATAKAIGGLGGQGLFVRTDVAQEEDVRSMVDAAVNSFGQLDILANVAGVTTTPAFPDAEAADWIRVLDVNLRGVMLGMHYGIRAMRAQSGGAIVNISSLAGVGIGPHSSPDYAATKAAVVRLSAALAPLAEQSGIRVNCICPDWVDTPMTQRTRARMSPEELAASVPPVLLSPGDISDAAVELITDDSLSGRILCCWCGRPRSFLPIDSER